MHDEPFTLLGISPEDWAKTPESVRLALRSLLDIVQAQSAQINALQTRVRDLEAKLGQTSRNSSKPPSSDPPSAPPPPSRTSSKRKSGAQPGHDGHHRPLIPPDEVHDSIALRPDHCPACRTDLAADLPLLGPPRRTQVWELPPITPTITEYRQYAVCCPTCSEQVTAPLPADAPPGALGPRATALIGLLRGRYRFSVDEAVEFLGDVCQLPLSSGCLFLSCTRLSEALAPIDADIQAAVQREATVNVDETSWPSETRRGWLWVAVGTRATCFRIHPSRGRPALRDLLGDGYRGVVGSDRLSTYKLLPVDQRQLCWSHLIRNLQGLHERYGEETSWPRRILAVVDDLFLVWNGYRARWYDQIALHQALIPIRLALHAELTEGLRSDHARIVGLSNELLAQWEALWTFRRVEGVAPTNNAAERALRPAVLWRKGCFGSRSAVGCRFVERMLSVRATCEQQSRSLFTFLTQAVRAAWTGSPPPVLVPTS